MNEKGKLNSERLIEESKRKIKRPKPRNDDE